MNPKPAHRLTLNGPITPTSCFTRYRDAQTTDVPRNPRRRYKSNNNHCSVHKHKQQLKRCRCCARVQSMAENSTKSETTVIVASKEEEKRDGGLFGIFSKFRVNFPPISIQETTVVAPGLTKNGDEESKTQKPESVKIPVASPKDFPSLKLESEESEPEPNPGNMWQVYAIGGFMILSWMWARWKESRTKKPGTGDEEPTPEDNDD